MVFFRKPYMQGLRSMYAGFATQHNAKSHRVMVALYAGFELCRV
jgi:hypothetical protein